MVYGAEVHSETENTKQMLRTAQMSTIKFIVGKTRLYRVRIVEARKHCGVFDIIKFTRMLRKEWNDHVSRAEVNRLMKITSGLLPNITRLPGIDHQIGGC